jgi:FAD/FMN-containing dehydrogenase
MEISQTGLKLMSRIKSAFDPNGILNPGKIFDVN